MLSDLFGGSSKAFVSVIIPTRNRSFLLSRAIESVLNQKYNEIELIVVDDASEDNTSQVVERYRQRFRNFRYIRNNSQCGGAKARNIGISVASGKYISFLDDDDEWLSEKVEFQQRFLNSHPDVMAVSCWYIEDTDGRKRKVRKYEQISFENMLWENFLGSFSFVMVRREIFEKIGLLDESLTICQDWDLWLKVSKDYKVCVVNKFLSIYYKHGGDKITALTAETISSYSNVYGKYKGFMSEACRRHHLKKLIIWESKLVTGTKNRLVKFIFLLKKHKIKYESSLMFTLHGFLSLSYGCIFSKRLINILKRPFQGSVCLEFRKIYGNIYRKQ